MNIKVQNTKVKHRTWRKCRLRIFTVAQVMYGENMQKYEVFDTNVKVQNTEVQVFSKNTDEQMKSWTFAKLGSTE